MGKISDFFMFVVLFSVTIMIIGAYLIVYHPDTLIEKIFLDIIFPWTLVCVSVYSIIAYIDKTTEEQSS